MREQGKITIMMSKKATIKIILLTVFLKKKNDSPHNLCINIHRHF